MADANVVIVGAGPVGLMTALGLAQAGIEVTVLDAKTADASGYDDVLYPSSTLPGLQRLGVLADMAHAGIVAQQWCVRVRPTGERIVFDLSLVAGDIEHPYNLLLPQPRLAEVVLAHLAAHPRATVAWRTEVAGLTQDARGVTVVANGPEGPHTFRAHWVVGTDGAHSNVRRSLGLGFTGLTWPHRFISTETRFDWAQLGFCGTSYQVDFEHPAVVARLDNTGLWRYVYAESRALAEETITDRMSAVFKAVLPEGADPGLQGWSAYRVHERAADQFRVGRVVLAGDAAHVTNPTGSIGLASGLFDSFALVDALTAVCHGADDELLDRYAHARRRAFLDITSPLSSERMHLVFDSDDPVRLDRELEPYRHAAADPRMLREFLSEAGNLQSASLL